MLGKLSLSVVYIALCTFLFLGVSVPVLAEYQVIDVTNGGTITGVTTWKEEVPDLPPIELGADPNFCGEEVPSLALQVNPKNKGVRYVLVYLEKVEKGKAPAAKYWLHMGSDSKNAVPGTATCQFKEHIFPFVRSQVMAMINFDPIFHNPHFFNAKNISLLNIPMPISNQELDHKYLQYPGKNDKGVMRLQCDVHSNMNAYWAGFDHPYFAVTDADGKFEINGVPSGKYTLVAWHEGYKVIREEAARPFYDRPHIRRQEIEVKPRESVEVNFEFPVRKVTIEY